jgi:NAD(P)-dependent dehydrogenase (short-subunit alcohol dehydrogenase family)
MTVDLNNKVVLITGSTDGLGRAAATALLARGARLALLDLDLHAAQDQANALGGPEVACAWQANVCSMESLNEGFAAVEKHFGRIDIVIANAGIGNTAPLETLTESAFERTIDVNLNGVFRTFKAALSYVKATQGYLLAVKGPVVYGLYQCDIGLSICWRQ